MTYSVALRQLHDTQSIPAKVQTLGLRIHGDAVAKGHAARDIALVQLNRFWFAFQRFWQSPTLANVLNLYCVPFCTVVSTDGNGAQEKTRTSTTLRPQVPETCASTNSATWALAIWPFSSDLFMAWKGICHHLVIAATGISSQQTCTVQIKT